MFSFKAPRPRLMAVVATSIALIGAGLVVRAAPSSFDSLALAQDKPGGAAAQERIAALKQSLAQSQQRLRQYEWIETTVVSLKGEEKSRKVLRCYYGADGKIEKLPVSSPADAPAAAVITERGTIYFNTRGEAFAEADSDVLSEFAGPALAPLAWRQGFKRLHPLVRW